VTAAIIIPARFGSSRFPGKPMQPVAGIPMLERVWRIAKSVARCSRVIVATEDTRIVDFAQSFHAEAVLTSPQCRNGTERVFDALKQVRVSEDIIINLQGDAVLTPPWILDSMITEMESNPGISVVTPAVALSEEALEAFSLHKAKNESSGTTVVFDRNRDALYFSKRIVPYTRPPAVPSIYRHIGLYGYRRVALTQYCELAPSPLEQAEGLEQLRLLENGFPIRVVIVDYRGRSHASVDNLADVQFAEAIIAREGELFVNR
jgi:3-deoxy-manno-octulosonate cytidylyltransferase (CMP-KDO synthetase)